MSSTFLPYHVIPWWYWGLLGSASTGLGKLGYVCVGDIQFHLADCAPPSTRKVSVSATVETLHRIGED